MKFVGSQFNSIYTNDYYLRYNYTYQNNSFPIVTPAMQPTKILVQFLLHQLCISRTRSGVGFCMVYLNMRHAKSQCISSSREINSLENVNPGIKLRFFNQKIAAKLPLKNIPSTAENAITRSPKVAVMLFVH